MGDAQPAGAGGAPWPVHSCRSLLTCMACALSRLACTAAYAPEGPRAKSELSSRSPDARTRTCVRKL
jgi:hypothetical protein